MTVCFESSGNLVFLPPEMQPLLQQYRAGELSWPALTSALVEASRGLSAPAPGEVAP